MKRLGLGIIREEFVKLTGDHISAILLNHCWYLTNCFGLVQKLIEEEQQRKDPSIGKLDLEEGWFYKCQEDFSSETSLLVSLPTIKKKLKALEKKGFLNTRKNPNNKWDRTLQYRLNLSFLEEELKKIGYILPELSILVSTSKKFVVESKEVCDRSQTSLDAIHKINSKESIIKKDNHPSDDMNPSGSTLLEQSSSPTQPNNNKKKKGKLLVDKNNPAYQLILYLRDTIRISHPDFDAWDELALQKGAKEFKRALEKNKSDFDDIKQVIDYVWSPRGWPGYRFKPQRIVNNFLEILNEMKLKTKTYDIRERDPELTKLVVNYWGQFTGQATSTEKWEPSPEVKLDLTKIANNLCIMYKNSPIQDKWVWITTFGKFLESEYKNKGIVPRLSFLLRPSVWENDFPIWKQINGGL